jgi:Zn-dependent M28 family amino/carboxypeptidase
MTIKPVHLLLILSLSTLLIQCSLLSKTKVSENQKEDPSKLSLERLQELQTKEQNIKILTDLSSDSMEGRLPGTKGMEKATIYVEDFLKQNNLVPFFGKSYRDSFKLGRSQAYNIVAMAKKYNKEEGMIVIGAHLDHLGLKPNYYNSSTIDTVYNGANDNISGVTAVLQIAKVFSQYDFKKNIMFVLFSGEEKEFAGSWHLSNKLKRMNVEINYMLNFEMIGTVLNQGNNMTFLTGYDLSNLAEVMNTKVGRKLVTYEYNSKKHGLFKRSDNYPFFRTFNIPAHSFSTFDFNNFDYYHHVDDEVDKLNVENMSLLINDLSLSISKIINEGAEVKLH